MVFLFLFFVTGTCQGCTTYFTDSARNISGREVGAQCGLGNVPPVGSRYEAPRQGDFAP